MTLFYDFVSSLFHKRKGTIILEHGNISNIIKDLSNADLHFRLEGMITGSLGAAEGFGSLQKQALWPQALFEQRSCAGRHVLWVHTHNVLFMAKNLMECNKRTT